MKAAVRGARKAPLPTRARSMEAELAATIQYVVDRVHEDTVTIADIAEEVTLLFAARHRALPWSSIRAAERQVREAIFSRTAQRRRSPGQNS